LRIGEQPIAMTQCRDTKYAGHDRLATRTVDEITGAIVPSAVARGECQLPIEIAAFNPCAGLEVDILEQGRTSRDRFRTQRFIER
jgi:hypothetical protein